VSVPEPRPRWAAVSLRDAPGWLVSLGIHAVALVAMLAFKIHADAREDMSIESAMEGIETEQFLESTTADQVGVGHTVTPESALGSGGGAVSFHTAESLQEEVRQKVNEEFKSPDVRLADDIEQPAEADLTGSVNLSGGNVENMAQGNGGVAGAIDRLAWEITTSLRQGETTVIWLFDQSLSLKERRDMIADRFENVYRQLESLGQGGEGALQTAVAIYGEKFTLLTEKPVNDVKTVIPKVRSIPDDPSGKENVFAAVSTLVTRFRSERARKRNVMIFIITDEKGDDAEKYLEETIKNCRRAGIKVYAVGNAALFGREKGFVKWSYPDGTIDDEPVDAGPETVDPEALALGFWGGRGPDLTRMSSGYGPYGLTRLCKETGGLFFIAQEEAREKFSPAVMRTYQPDYRPIKDYRASLGKNKAMLGLVMSAKQTKIEDIPLPRLGFQAYNDTILREEITEAQKPAAELTYKIDRIVEVLGQGEKDRAKIIEPRWRAAYDLAVGRALAIKVRAQGYNQMLADMKGQPRPFQKKDSNEWRIVPSKTINAGQAVKKLEQQAATYLKRVMDEHPETPWARLAEMEFSIPMGWEWQEVNNPAIFPARTNPEEARRQIRLAEEQARLAAPKRPLPPSKVRPKL
jgi:von Willebrand factor type A domain